MALWSRTPVVADVTPTPADGEEDAFLDHIGRRMLKRQVDALKSLPAFPESVLRINAMLAEGESAISFRAIAGVIETDPALCARVLRLVNSAFYGVSGTMGSAYDALVMLGLDVVKGIILSTSVLELVQRRGGLGGLWEHSYGAAVAAGALGRVLDLPKVEELSAAALMHDLGKVVLASQLPDEYPRVVEYALREEVSIREAEQRTLGVTHDEIGRWLVTRWKLPAVLAEPIAFHHTPARARAHKEAAAVVHVADLLIRGYGFGFAGDAVMPPPDDAAFRTLRLRASTLREAVRRLHDDLQAAQVNVNLLLRFD